MQLWQNLSTIFLFAMLAFLAGFFVYLYKERAAGPGRLFLPCLLFWGILYSLVFIPFTAPDEYAHFASAYRLSSQIMGQAVYNDEGQVWMREGDARQLWPELSAESYEEVYGDFLALDHSQGRVGYGHVPMEVAFHAYLPQALGITLGRLLSLGQVLTIYLGRLCNLLFFAFCAYQAVRFAPFGKMVFFGTAMLPMTLELVSSLSYDAFAIGLGMLFTAYALHLAYESPQVGKRELLVLAVLLAALAPCKMVYIPLAGLCFLIPREKFGSGKRYRQAALLVAACAAAAVLAVNLDKILVYFQGTEDPVSWAGGVAGYSFSAVLADPLAACKVVGNTLIRKMPSYLNSMVGGSLGWLEHEIDPTLILFLLLWTALAALPVRGKGAAAEMLQKTGRPQEAGQTQEQGGGPSDEPWEIAVMPVRHRLVSLALCVCSVLSTMFIMLMSWTPFDSPFVEGVQGRYFLPVLPLGLLALRGRKLSLEAPVERILAGGYCLMNLLVLQSIAGRVV